MRSIWVNLVRRKARVRRPGGQGSDATAEFAAPSSYHVSTAICSTGELPSCDHLLPEFHERLRTRISAREELPCTFMKGSIELSLKHCTSCADSVSQILTLPFKVGMQ